MNVSKKWHLSGIMFGFAVNNMCNLLTSKCDYIWVSCKWYVQLTYIVWQEYFLQMTLNDLCYTRFEILFLWAYGFYGFVSHVKVQISVKVTTNWLFFVQIVAHILPSAIQKWIKPYCNNKHSYDNSFTISQWSKLEKATYNFPNRFVQYGNNPSDNEITSIRIHLHSQKCSL